MAIQTIQNNMLVLFIFFYTQNIGNKWLPRGKGQGGWCGCGGGRKNGIKGQSQYKSVLGMVVQHRE